MAVVLAVVASSGAFSRWMAVLAVLGAACGSRTPPWPEEAGERVSVVAECTRNADCGPTDVCNGDRCLFFGQCLSDRHCYPGAQCLEQRCRRGDAGARDAGSAPRIELGSSLRCDINNDCPGTEICVERQCRAGVQCTAHAHCSLGRACARSSCLPLFDDD